MNMDRRGFVSSTFAGFGALSLGTSFTAIASSSPFRKIAELRSVGELLPPNELGLRLPQGFSARIVAQGSSPVMLASGEESSYTWHKYADGGACYATEDGGWIYTSNSEVGLGLGGAGALRFSQDGEIIDAYRILSGTSSNCAGGPTPWQTWLSCEETSFGKVFECDIYGKRAALPCPGLGFFKHEAVALDPYRQRAYLTEDEKDGCLYRYTALDTKDGRFDFQSGFLELASLDDEGYVSWLPVPNPNPKWYQAATRHQVPSATHFDGGEGIWFHEGRVIFTTKGEGRVWEYEIATNRMKVIYSSESSANPVLSGPDNVVVTSDGQILVAEDNGDMQIVVLGENGEAYPLVQVMGQNLSEICGPAISPRGDKLYFSSQRGNWNGITYEVTGPFVES